ncbi:MAG: cytochrome c5, partial [Pseudohongiellaceae bacterium]
TLPWLNFVYAVEADSFDPAQTYQNTCFACHGTGAAHAPEVGDVIEWEIRLEKGLDTLVQNTISGLNGVMPAKGLCVVCSDEQLKAVVEYMLEHSE